MKLLAFLALTTVTTAQEDNEMRFLQDSEGKTWKESLELKQPEGPTCDGFYRFDGYAGLEELKKKMTYDEAKAMDDAAKVEWMEANYYDKSKDTCESGKSCSWWLKSAKNDAGQIVPASVMMQTCQDCTWADPALAEREAAAVGFDALFPDPASAPDYDSMTDEEKQKA